MADYICIDGGTTNTRISLVGDKRIIDTVNLHIGAKAGIDNNKLLRAQIKDSIQKLLNDNKRLEADISRILASGMITSEFGLLELRHITLPAGIAELHTSMHTTVLDDISNIPFTFIRGVKTVSDTFETAEMTRGEESEVIGISENGEGVYILPGSHTKIIEIDKNGKITNIKTRLTGEMIAALSQNTILKSAFDIYNANLDKEYLLKGFSFCKANGIGEALFKVRVLRNLFGVTESQAYSFFMGAVLLNEVAPFENIDTKQIIIGGKKQIREALAYLLDKTCNADIICFSDQAVEFSNMLGMIKIFEFKGE